LGQPPVRYSHLLSYRWFSVQLDQLKQLTEKLNDRDRERDVMLQELQFRLKDCLQSVASLLAMAARDTDSKEAANVLNDVMYRMQVMSAVYSMACGTDDISRVSMKEIVEKVLSNAIQILPCPKCRLDVDVDDIRLPVHTAMPVAQILGELVLDSIRQAAREDGRVRMVVDRTGISVSPRNGYDRIGMYLVDILAQQLGGTITRDGETVKVNIDTYIDEANHGTSTDR